MAEFADTADPDETAHNKPSHLDLQCLPSSLCRCKFVVSFLCTLKVDIAVATGKGSGMSTLMCRHTRAFAG